MNTTIPYKVDKLSIIYGLIVYGKHRVKFTQDNTFYLAQISAQNESDPDEMTTVGWIDSSEWRILVDSKIVSEEDIVKKV